MEIDTNNPAPSLHPLNITEQKHFDVHGDAVKFVADEFSVLYGGIGKTAQLSKELSKVAHLTKEQKILKIAEVGEKHKHRAMSGLVSMDKNLKEKIQGTEKELSKPFTSGKTEHNIEIRAHFKNLSSEDRQKQITHAINTGDVLTAKSVLGAPAYLSGFTDDLQKGFTRHYHEINQPELIQRLNLLESTHAKVERAIGFLHGVYEKAIGADVNTVHNLKQDEAKTKAALTAAE